MCVARAWATPTPCAARNPVRWATPTSKQRARFATPNDLRARTPFGPTVGAVGHPLQGPFVDLCPRVAPRCSFAAPNPSYGHHTKGATFLHTRWARSPNGVRVARSARDPFGPGRTLRACTFFPSKERVTSTPTVEYRLKAAQSRVEGPLLYKCQDTDESQRSRRPPTQKHATVARPNLSEARPLFLMKFYGCQRRK